MAFPEPTPVVKNKDAKAFVKRLKSKRGLSPKKAALYEGMEEDYEILWPKESAESDTK